MTSKLHLRASKEVISFINKLLCLVASFAATSETFSCLQLGAGLLLAAPSLALRQPGRCCSVAARLPRGPDTGLCAHVCANTSAEMLQSEVLKGCQVLCRFLVVMVEMCQGSSKDQILAGAMRCPAPSQWPWCLVAAVSSFWCARCDWCLNCSEIKPAGCNKSCYSQSFIIIYESDHWGERCKSTVVVNSILVSENCWLTKCNTSISLKQNH